MGVGVRGMQERVKQIGGSLAIRFNGKGTSVLAALPLTEEPASPHESAARRPEDPFRRSRRDTKPPLGRSQSA